LRSLPRHRVASEARTLWSGAVVATRAATCPCRRGAGRRRSTARSDLACGWHDGYNFPEK
jgi:hypothetical protein